ncbi:hypothetical protein D3C87_1512470 [compost metagenome]
MSAVISSSINSTRFGSASSITSDLTIRAISTLLEADPVKPPTCTTKSFKVRFSKYSYSPGFLTSPSIVILYSSLKSKIEYTVIISSLFNSISAFKSPDNAALKSTFTISVVKSVFKRMILALLVYASSFSPSALVIRSEILIPSL